MPIKQSVEQPIKKLILRQPIAKKKAKKGKVA
jgi:hypothetical protein